MDPPHTLIANIIETANAFVKALIDSLNATVYARRLEQEFFNESYKKAISRLFRIRVLLVKILSTDYTSIRPEHAAYQSLSNTEKVKYWIWQNLYFITHSKFEWKSNA